MRPIEIAIPLFLTIYLLWPHPRPMAIRSLPALTIMSMVIHVFIEGYRWQMIAIYGLTALLLVSSLIKIQSPADWKPIASYFAFILLAVSTALPILLPVPRIPPPGGPYEVGTRIYELTDEARREIYSGKDEARRFMIQVWYPSEASASDERAPWMANAEIFATSIAGQIDMPPFFLDHLALVKIPAYKESAIAPSSTGYPIILFSHGWNGFNAQDTGQALQLASRGYVVIGVQHTYGAVITVFPNGDFGKNNPSALPDGAPTDEYEAAAHLLSDQWAGDLGYALDFMKSQNEDASSPFHNVLNLNQVGVYGHSTGGGAAIQLCGKDPRCSALLGMDPFMRPVSYEIIDHGISQPSFYMFSQRWTDDVESRNNELFNRFYPNISNAFGVITIEGTAHYDFTDLPLLSPLASKLGLKGPINGARVTLIVNDYLLSFFDATLKGIQSSLFENPGTYPEAKQIK